MRRISLQNSPENSYTQRCAFLAILSNYNSMRVYICRRFIPTTDFLVFAYLLGEEGSPTIGNTLWRVSTMFTRSAITPPELNGFG